MSNNNREILLLTHGGWGQVLTEKLTMIVGPVEGVTEISLESTDSPESYMKRVEKKLNKMPSDCLVITDIAGGTPSNVALQLSRKFNIHILSGLNSIMLIEAIMKKEEPFTNEIVNEIKNAAIENCKHLKI